MSRWSANLSATCKAAENDCLERRNSIRPCVPSHVAYKAERGGNELFWSPWKMYPRSQERRRNREATVYLPALGGDGPRLDRDSGRQSPYLAQRAGFRLLPVERRA